MTGFNKTNRNIIYGPVNSRRFGVSLGINISGSRKVCSFNCLYCFRGFNEKDNEEDLPGVEEVLAGLEQFLERYDREEIEDWAIAGNGEPTDNPCLTEIIHKMTTLRDKIRPGVKVSLLTNGMGFIPSRNPRTTDLLNACKRTDRVCLKLDSGIPATWKQINNPAGRISFEEWFKAVKAIDKPVIQTMLMTGRVDNTTECEVENLIKCYRELKPMNIQIVTIDKQPADNMLKPAPRSKIQEIDYRIRRMAK